MSFALTNNLVHSVSSACRFSHNFLLWSRKRITSKLPHCPNKAKLSVRKWIRSNACPHSMDIRMTLVRDKDERWIQLNTGSDTTSSAKEKNATRPMAISYIRSKTPENKVQLHSKCTQKIRVKALATEFFYTLKILLSALGRTNWHNCTVPVYADFKLNIGCLKQILGEARNKKSQAWQ